MSEDLASGEISWQKKLKLRGLKLIGWTLPLMLFSLFASSLVSHVPPQMLMERNWGEKRFMSGRFISPIKGSGEVSVVLLLKGPTPAPPKGTLVSLRFKSVEGEGEDDVKRSWKLAPHPVSSGWQAAFFTRIPAGQNLAYLFRLKSEYPHAKEISVQLIADPEKASDKYFRMAEVFFYPMLALALMGAVMVVFPHVFAR